MQPLSGIMGNEKLEETIALCDDHDVVLVDAFSLHVVIDVDDK
jgi:hypothetical protein